MTSRRLIITIAILIAAIGIFWTWNTEESGVSSFQKTSKTRSKDTRKRISKRKYQAPQKPPPILSPLDKEQVYTELNRRESFQIKCPAPENIDDGVYRSEETLKEKGRKLLQYALVQNGEFTALVASADGEVTLLQELWPKAVVRWNGAEAAGSSCEIETLGRIQVSGRLLKDDGQPAAEKKLNTCEHGKHVLTDEQGNFSFSAPRAHPCWLIGIVDSEKGIGRGPATEIDTSEDADNIEIRLPPDSKLMNDDMIEKVAAQLFQMTQIRFNEERKRSDQLLDFENKELSDSGKEVIQAMLDEEQWRIEAMEETMYLSDPDSDFDEKKEAVRQMFFQNYY